MGSLHSSSKEDSPWKAFFKILLLLSVVSVISSFTSTRVERSASASPHMTYYTYALPYSYSYYPYYSLLYGRKKRDAEPFATPHYGYYGYGYRRYPYYGYGYYYGRKKDQLKPNQIHTTGDMDMDMDT